MQIPQNELSQEEVIFFLKRIFEYMAVGSFALIGILSLIRWGTERKSKIIPQLPTDIVMTTGETTTPKH